MPTRRLPSDPSVEDFQRQASAARAGHEAAHPDVAQRIREFHPRFAGATDAEIAAAPFTLRDARTLVAREYGFRTWARLQRHIALPPEERENLDLPPHERIADAAFRRGVELIDAGEVTQLRAHLRSHRGLVRRRVVLEGGNYFQNPTLLEFVAENPVRRGWLPPNIVEVARTILEAGGHANRTSLDATLALVSSGRVPRECGVQVPLIDLLCDHGANPDAAVLPALVPGETGAIEALIRRGATLDLTVAAGLGRLDDVRRLLPGADGAARQRALTLAAHHGHADVLAALLDAGEDPNRYNPVGCHAHSTPLHQAAYFGRTDAVKVLVERGARLDLRDIHHRGTPLIWAEYAGRVEIAAYLRAHGGKP